MSFFDDFTSYAWVTCLHKKSDVLDVFRHFAVTVETQHNAKIKHWRSDAKREFKSLELDEELKSCGIIVEQSAPYTSQQNGHAERFNHTIMDKAQILRFQACLPESWWEFALEHAIHLYNITSIAHLGWKTPHEQLYKALPSVDHLQIFGCGAYVYLPENVRKNKLTPKSELMVYLGQIPGIKRYRFMRLHNNSLFIGTTAFFDENIFPKCPDFNNFGSTTFEDEKENNEEHIPINNNDDDTFDISNIPSWKETSRKREVEDESDP
ncbi:hypothetical protein AX16_001242 [Volvariella volvacea WC 439]|nr:hypothetical protein AX16_001242 [Volvariella volvacea WC 439]